MGDLRNCGYWWKIRCCPIQTNPPQTLSLSRSSHSHTPHIPCSSYSSSLTFPHFSLLLTPCLPHPLSHPITPLLLTLPPHVPSLSPLHHPSLLTRWTLTPHHSPSYLPWPLTARHCPSHSSTPTVISLNCLTSPSPITLSHPLLLKFPRPSHFLIDPHSLTPHAPLPPSLSFFSPHTPSLPLTPSSLPLVPHSLAPYALCPLIFPRPSQPSIHPSPLIFLAFL